MKRKQLPKPQYYVVMDQNGLVFSGLQYGEPKWDANWNNAKPLELSSTQYLLRGNKHELIKQEEIL
jgi:hypothetical protein